MVSRILGAGPKGHPRMANREANRADVDGIPTAAEFLARGEEASMYTTPDPASVGRIRLSG